VSKKSTKGPDPFRSAALESRALAFPPEANVERFAAELLD
jgi:hypothetical protein